MSYPAVGDVRMPYDTDGSVLVTAAQNLPYTTGPSAYPNGTQLAAINGYACLVGSGFGPWGSFAGALGMWFFFPEQREITGIYMGYGIGPAAFTLAPTLEASNDTTNGLDGTWETAGTGSPLPATTTNPEMDSWRLGIVAVSFTGPKKVLRIHATVPNGSNASGTVIHLYGAKGAGQTPDDILYLDGQHAYATFTSVEDFGDVPLGTTTTRTFKVQNSSATKTANSINLQCNDADFAISSDGSTWVTTINIASLAAGASSGVLYVRNTTPSPGAALGPRFGRIVCTVGSWV